MLSPKAEFLLLREYNTNMTQFMFSIPEKKIIFESCVISKWWKCSSSCSSSKLWLGAEKPVNYVSTKLTTFPASQTLQYFSGLEYSLRIMKKTPRIKYFYLKVLQWRKSNLPICCTTIKGLWSGKKTLRLGYIIKIAVKQNPWKELSILKEMINQIHSNTVAFNGLPKKNCLACRHE